MKNWNEVRATIENGQRAVQAGCSLGGHQVECYLSEKQEFAILVHQDASSCNVSHEWLGDVKSSVLN
jgi:hypothetical protein